MKQFIVTAREERYLHMTIEAETPEEALKKAREGDVLDQEDGDYLGLNDSSEWGIEEAYWMNKDG
jgi:hypothetical protein